MEQERTFFRGPKWIDVALMRRCGISALKARLSELLQDMAK